MTRAKPGRLYFTWSREYPDEGSEVFDANSYLEARRKWARATGMPVADAVASVVTEDDVDKLRDNDRVSTLNELTLRIAEAAAAVVRGWAMKRRPFADPKANERLVALVKQLERRTKR